MFRAYVVVFQPCSLLKCLCLGFLYIDLSTLWTKLLVGNWKVRWHYRHEMTRITEASRIVLEDEESQIVWMLTWDGPHLGRIFHTLLPGRQPSDCHLQSKVFWTMLPPSWQDICVSWRIQAQAKGQGTLRISDFSHDLLLLEFKYLFFEGRKCNRLFSGFQGPRGSSKPQGFHLQTWMISSSPKVNLRIKSSCTMGT